MSLPGRLRGAERGSGGGADQVGDSAASDYLARADCVCRYVCMHVCMYVRVYIGTERSECIIIYLPTYLPTFRPWRPNDLPNSVVGPDIHTYIHTYERIYRRNHISLCPSQTCIHPYLDGEGDLGSWEDKGENHTLLRGENHLHTYMHTYMR